MCCFKLTLILWWLSIFILGSVPVVWAVVLMLLVFCVVVALAYLCRKRSVLKSRCKFIYAHQINSEVLWVINTIIFLWTFCRFATFSNWKSSFNRSQPGMSALYTYFYPKYCISDYNSNTKRTAWISLGFSHVIA